MSHFSVENPKHRIFKRHWWSLRYYVQWQEQFAFFWTEKETWIVVEPSTQDGHSIPLPVTVSILTLGQFHPMMVGLKAAAVHDVSCQNKLFNRKDRYRLYRAALAETDAEKWKSSILWKAAAVGSVMGYC